MDKKYIFFNKENKTVIIRKLLWCKRNKSLQDMPLKEINPLCGVNKFVNPLQVWPHHTTHPKVFYSLHGDWCSEFAPLFWSENKNQHSLLTQEVYNRNHSLDFPHAIKSQV